MEAQKQPMAPLRLDRVVVNDIQYHRNATVISKFDYETSFERKVDSEDDVNFRVSLTCKLQSEDNAVTLSITVTGYFYCDCEDKKIKNVLVSNNATAILFPYLRSQVSLVTTQPDIPPIVIPPMNVLALFKAETE